MRNKILIVDDEEPTRSSLVGTLGDFYSIPKDDILCFEDAESAYNYLKKNHQKVKMVMTDENMAEMKGTEFIRRGYDLDSDVNFISMSAGEIGKASGKEIEEIARSVGAVDFFEKPFGIEEIERIENYL